MNRTVTFSLFGVEFTFEGVNKSTALLLATAFGAIAIAAWVIIPLVCIWALNTLFPMLAIPWGVSEWAAALVLLVLITYRNTSKSK